MKISISATNFEASIVNDEGESVAKVTYTDYKGEVDIAAAIRGGLTIATLLEAGKAKFAAAVEAASNVEPSAE